MASFPIFSNFLWSITDNTYIYKYLRYEVQIFIFSLI